MGSVNEREAGERWPKSSGGRKTREDNQCSGALDRLFAPRREGGIFEVSEHNLEEARSWLEFSIGRTQSKERLLEYCQDQPTGTVQIFTRDRFATDDSRGTEVGYNRSLPFYLYLSLSISLLLFVAGT